MSGLEVFLCELKSSVWEWQLWHDGVRRLNWVHQTRMAVLRICNISAHTSRK